MTTTTSRIKMLLEQTAPFSGFTTAERDILATAVVLQEYPSEAVILEQGRTQHQYLYIVLSGVVRLIETTTGNVTRTFGEGKQFGHYGLLRGGSLPFQAQALEQTELVLVPAPLFHKLCSEHPRVAAFFESDISVYTRHQLTFYDLSGAQFLFGTRLRELVNRSPSQCEPDASVKQAAKIMNRHNCDYIVVIRNCEPIGLLTDRHLRSRVVATETSTNTPVSEIMNTDLGYLNERNSLFEALLMMLERGQTHILIRTMGTNKLMGVVSDPDITRAHGYSPLLVLNQIEQATSISQLAEHRGEANRLLLQLYRRGVRAQDLITINTLVNDHLTGRVLSLSEKELEEFRPEIQLHWAWLSLGSEGRGEMSLKTDQDNALVYQVSNAEAAAAEQWLALWAERVNQSLDEIGLTLCSGDMMARNPLWRLSAEEWPQRFQDWLEQAKANQIMQISAACDLRAVHGHLELEQSVKTGLKQALTKNRRFLKHMAAGVVANRLPLQRFTGRIRTQKTAHGKTINIKKNGLQPIADFARILALQIGFLDSSNTFERLDYLAQAQPDIANTIRDALEAYRYLNDIRLGHHLQTVASGGSPDNLILVGKLSDTQTEMLKAAFSTIESIQALLAQRFSLMSR